MKRVKKRVKRNKVEDKRTLEGDSKTDIIRTSRNDIYIFCFALILFVLVFAFFIDSFVCNRRGDNIKSENYVLKDDNSKFNKEIMDSLNGKVLTSDYYVSNSSHKVYNSKTKYFVSNTPIKAVVKDDYLKVEDFNLSPAQVTNKEFINKVINSRKDYTLVSRYQKDGGSSAGYIFKSGDDYISINNVRPTGVRDNRINLSKVIDENSPEYVIDEDKILKEVDNGNRESVHDEIFLNAVISNIKSYTDSRLNNYVIVVSDFKDDNNKENFIKELNDPSSKLIILEEDSTYGYKVGFSGESSSFMWLNTLY